MSDRERLRKLERGMKSVKTIIDEEQNKRIADLEARIKKLEEKWSKNKKKEK
jgi:hypothetical protein